MTIKAGDLAAELGKGLIAGAVGTAAMTLSSTIEMKRRGREASTTPADAASKVLDVEPTGEREKEKFSNLVHFGYGTSWGSVRALLEVFGLRGPAATGIHFAAVWGAGLVMLPSLKVAPPVTEWGPQEVAIDGFHHLVYAASTGVAYGLLNRSSS